MTPAATMLAADTAVILAAGWGSRMQGLADNAEPISKPLIPLEGHPMLLRVMKTLAAGGVHHFVVVTGYLREKVEAAAKAWGLENNCKVTCVYNPEWDTLANGVSALVAREAVQDTFILSMADHAFDLAIVQQLQAEGPRQMGVRLCIDRKLSDVFDMDDATKVVTQGDVIVGIDKKLDDFNAVDIGLFICRPELFDALEVVKEKQGDCSLSDGMRRLGQEGRFGYMDIGKYYWQDADTPETLEHAEALIANGKLNFLK